MFHSRVCKTFESHSVLVESHIKTAVKKPVYYNLKLKVKKLQAKQKLVSLLGSSLLSSGCDLWYSQLLFPPLLRGHLIDTWVASSASKSRWLHFGRVCWLSLKHSWPHPIERTWPEQVSNQQSNDFTNLRSLKRQTVTLLNTHRRTSLP